MGQERFGDDPEPSFLIEFEKGQILFQSGWDNKFSHYTVELLSQKGIEAAVVDMHTIKPLDEELVKRLAAECKLIVTVEDHSVIGGLGGAVAE